MKTIVVLALLASVLILTTCQAQAEASDPVKNRRLLSDVGRSYSTNPPRDWIIAEANNIGDDEDSSPEQNTHHVFPNENYVKPHN